MNTTNDLKLLRFGSVVDMTLMSIKSKPTQENFHLTYRIFHTHVLLALA